MNVPGAIQGGCRYPWLFDFGVKITYSSLQWSAPNVAFSQEQLCGQHTVPSMHQWFRQAIDLCICMGNDKYINCPILWGWQGVRSIRVWEHRVWGLSDATSWRSWSRRCYTYVIVLVSTLLNMELHAYTSPVAGIALGSCWECLVCEGLWGSIVCCLCLILLISHSSLLPDASSLLVEFCHWLVCTPLMVVHGFWQLCWHLCSACL